MRIKFFWGKVEKALYNANMIKYNTVITLLQERILKMKKFVTMLLALCMMLVCLTGCGQSESSDLSYIQGKGKLVVGITEYAPMDYKDESGQWTGFDAEFARLFAEELGVEVEFRILSDWGKKFYELETKNIDVIWNGMTITEEVTLNSSCSDPYVINAQVVVMQKDMADKYPDAESMRNLTFAVENGSAGQEAVAGIGAENMVLLQDQAAALMEVAAGTSDACVIDITMARAMTGTGTGYENLVIALTLTSEEYGVGFRKGSDVTAGFNAFLAESMADGTLDALAEKYGLTLAR